MSDSSDSIKVLVVDDEAESLQSIQAALKNLGVPEANIRLAQDSDQAMNILFEEAKDEAEGVRKQIALMLCGVHLSTQSDGAIFMGEVKTGMPQEVRPYVVAMSAKDQSPETVELLKSMSDDFLAKGTPDFLGDKLKGAIEAAHKFIIDRAHEKAMADKAKGAQAEQSSGVVEPDSDDLMDMDVPTTGTIFNLDLDSKRPNYYTKKDKLRDLARPNDYPQGTRVALLDVDGTLAESFVMGRFARHLAQIFPQLLGDLPKAQRAKNQHALRDLLKVVENIEKGTFPKNVPYEEMIKEMDKLYREALTGLSVGKVCAAGAQWSKEDSKSNLYRYAKPIIDFLKHLGIVPTLVTGLPAEALSGYIDGLGGIEARCYPLELQTVKNERGELVYGEKIERETGLSNEKLAIARSIVDNGHDIYCAFGDQNSDLGMMRIATDIKKKEVAFGKAFYFANTKETKFAGHMAHINTSSSDSFGRRHLIVIDKDLELFAMLEEIAHSIFRMERWFQYQKGMVEASTEFRDRLHALVYHPYGKPDKDGNVAESNGGFKQFMVDVKK